MSILVFSLLIHLAGQQVLPPNLVENGDARAGASGWNLDRLPLRGARQPDKNAFVETWEGVPCFVLRNHGSWNQQVRLHEDHEGKYLLIIARGSSERVHPDDNITDLPYLWAQVLNDAPPSNDNVFQRMGLQSKTPNQWKTMHGIFRMPKNGRAITLKLSLGSRNGTPHDGSAGRFRHVEMRLFESRAEAEAYVAVYNDFHDSKVPR